jgi:hypothetical protein
MATTDTSAWVAGEFATLSETERLRVRRGDLIRQVDAPCAKSITYCAFVYRRRFGARATLMSQT